MMAARAQVLVKYPKKPASQPAPLANSSHYELCEGVQTLNCVAVS